MNKLATIILLSALLTGCITGNPWQQFLGNIQGFVGDQFHALKKELELGGRKELTAEGGYLLPNGNKQHEFWWGSKNGKTCILLIEENVISHKVVTVGGKGDTKACQWGG